MTNQDLLSSLQNHQNLSSHREAIVSTHYIPQQITSQNLKPFLSQHPAIPQKPDNIAIQLIMNGPTGNAAATNSNQGLVAEEVSSLKTNYERNMKNSSENKLGNNVKNSNIQSANDPKFINNNLSVNTAVGSKLHSSIQQQQLQLCQQQHNQLQQIYLIQQQQQQQQQQEQQQLWMLQEINKLYSENVDNNNSGNTLQRFPNDQNSNFPIMANSLADAVSEFNIPQYKNVATSGVQNDSNFSSSTAHLNSGFDLQASITNQQGPSDVNPNVISEMKNIEEVDEIENIEGQKIVQNLSDISSKPELNANNFFRNPCVVNNSLAGLPHVITNKKDSQNKNSNQQICYNSNISNQISLMNSNIMFSNSMMSSMIGNNFDIAPPPPSSSSSFSGISSDTLDQPFLESLANNNSQSNLAADNTNYIMQDQQQKHSQTLPGSIQQSFFQMNNGLFDKNAIPNSIFNFSASTNLVVPPSNIAANCNININSNTVMAAPVFAPNLYYPQNVIQWNNKSNNAPSSAGSDFSSIDTISPVSDRSSFGILPQYTGGKSKKQHRRRNTDPSSSSIARLQLLTNNASALHANNEGRGSFSSMSSVSSTSPSSTIINSENIPGKSNNGVVDGNNVPILTSSVPLTRGSSSVQMTVPETSSMNFHSNGRSMSFTDPGSAKRINTAIFLGSSQNNVNSSSESGNPVMIHSESSLIPGSEPETYNLANAKFSPNSGKSITNKSSTGSIIENISNVVPKPKNFCPHCNKSFKRPSSLQTHIYTHTGEKPFVCTKAGCNKWFSVRSNMIRHAKLHERDMNKDLNKFSN